MLLGCGASILLAAPALDAMGATSGTWSQGAATDWSRRRPWMLGCNFIPSSAVNALDMWQAETFDANGIDRETRLGRIGGHETSRGFSYTTLPGSATRWGSALVWRLSCSSRPVTA